jgi:non-ribosomal peptide synthetase component F
MILGNVEDPDNEGAERTTLDDLFRSGAARRPDALALCDPPNRFDFTDGKPRRLTYAQADRAVSAIAGRLRRLGLSTDTMVGLQLPNTVESVLTLLGVLRAGLIAAPLALLWRRADAAAALNRIGGKAFITASRIGSINHCDIAMHVAADVFPIRYVCSFGDGLADGVIPLDDMLGPEPLMDPTEPQERRGNPAAHIAAVTFELTPGGLAAVARSHAELIAGGRAVRLESGLPEEAVILTSCGSSSFAGLSAGIVPWLLCGGTLSLHHPFDAAAFARQFRQDRCDTVVLPGALVAAVETAGLLPAAQLRNVVAVWRTPERLANAIAWPHPQIRMVDVQAFGEAAVICGRRTPSGEPSESVRNHHDGLQSFRSMSLMEARRRNTSALRLRFSQSFARRRHLPSQANVRSTTHRRGKTTNPLATSDRFTISVLRCGNALA